MMMKALFLMKNFDVRHISFIPRYLVIYRPSCLFSLVCDFAVYVTATVVYTFVTCE